MGTGVEEKEGGIDEASLDVVGQPPGTEAGEEVKEGFSGEADGTVSQRPAAQVRQLQEKEVG